MNTAEERFRRLLRWYPRSWRDAHGEVVLATMLDAADADGRTAPTSAERRAAFVEGLGNRLTRRVAIVCATAASAIGVGLVPYWFTASNWGGVPVGLVLGVGVVPLLVLLAVVAAGRARGMLASGTTLATIGVGAVTVVLTTLALLSWSVGFDEADAGAGLSPFASAFGGLAVSAWLCAIALGALGVGGALGATALHSRWRFVLGAVAGAVVFPFLAIALVSPAAVALVALTTLVGVVLLTRRPPTDETPATCAPGRRAPSIGGHSERSVARARRWAAVCAGVSAVAACGTVTFALTGSHWPGGPVDSTRAMSIGIAGGFLSALPLCIALALARTGTHRGVAAWGPAALVGLSVSVAGGYNLVSTGDGTLIVWMLLLAALPLGAAVAWIIGTMGRGTAASRWVVGGVCGAGVVVMSTALQIAPFALPVIAATAAVLLLRPRRARPPLAEPAAAR